MMLMLMVELQMLLCCFAESKGLGVTHKGARHQMVVRFYFIFKRKMNYGAFHQPSCLSPNESTEWKAVIISESCYNICMRSSQQIFL